nr:hypothetical protein [Tanacetum cinerariifolium]
MVGVDINTLTMEQYLALSRENQASGVVKPEIKGNANFEIKSQFMREFREYTFSRNKNEDAHDHIDRVLIIELSTLGTSLKRPLSKGIVYYPRMLNSLKTSTTSSKKATNHYTKLGNGASVNVMPRNIFEYLRLANLRNTNMLVEMTDMTKKAPLCIIENIIVRIDKFLFPSDFKHDPDKDLMEKSFDDYRWVFDLEIEQLADEYELGIGKKVHILEMIWENCKKNQGSSS